MLKQLKVFLITMGFSASQSDPSLFFIIDLRYFIYMLVYVDGMVNTESSSKKINEVIESMTKEFAVKQLDDFKFFLGVMTV